MKFDVIVMNPPYQTKSDSKNTKTQPIWDKFVSKAFALSKENGHLCMIHPSGWRGCGNAFTFVKSIKNKQIEYLEIHDEKDGLKTFGVTTRYDWYVVKNCNCCKNTVFVGQDGVKEDVFISNIQFIPNSNFDKVFDLVAKDGEETVEIMHSYSLYETRKPYISKERNEKYIYPIVYSTPTVGPTIWYSSTNKNGHFGISKLILNPCRPIGFFIDKNGEYGMSQFCVGIVGDEEYLDVVAEVIANQKTNGFAEFMESCHFTDKIFNKDVISMFRKDFWKEFVNEDGTEKE